MDLNSFREFFVEDDENTFYFFIAGAKNCGKSSFSKKFINFLPKSYIINNLQYKENLLFSLRIKETYSYTINILEINNTDVLKELKLSLNKINKKCLIILFENFHKERDFLEKIISEVKQNFLFEKYLLIRTKCEINSENNKDFIQSFSSSLGKIILFGIYAFRI